ncbi:uncharacterized protein [Chelonus insularis]|uniref:uncharacterized protein n=1 Tax=Chelonus insularis TaxID=460826 RepID=UPI00158DDCA8|nr:uncharacterized protein LOC118064040 [Chelonus insularis]
MWKEFTLIGNYKWIDLVLKLLSSYDNTKHCTIEMKPVDVTSANEKQLFDTIYRKLKVLKIEKKKNKFKIAEQVRISKYKHAFEKYYTPNWTTEIFAMIKVKNTHLVTFKLTDHQNQLIEGGFYEDELTGVQYPDVYPVKTVLKKRGNQAYVKWLGFNNEHNSWINSNDI